MFGSPLVNYLLLDIRLMKKTQYILYNSLYKHCTVKQCLQGKKPGSVERKVQKQNNKYDG